MHSAIYQAEFLERVAKSRYIDPLEELWKNFRGNPGLEQMLYIDTKTWLPDDLLIKADKMTMANSLELRVPLLDHRILEFAARLPEDFKVRGSNGKRIFKASVSSMVPDEITKRKKVGFPVPYGRWFRSDLKGYLQEILLDDSTCARGYFRREAVEAMINGSIPYSDCAKDLFNLTVLELWHRAFVDRPLASLV
jgi:asparagine synthase (glutamine-hydrolysing)